MQKRSILWMGFTQKSFVSNYLLRNKPSRLFLPAFWSETEKLPHDLSWSRHCQMPGDFEIYARLNLVRYWLPWEISIRKATQIKGKRLWTSELSDNSLCLVLKSWTPGLFSLMDEFKATLPRVCPSPKCWPKKGCQKVRQSGHPLKTHLTDRSVLKYCRDHQR